MRRIIPLCEIQKDTVLPLYTEVLRYEKEEGCTMHSHEFVEIGITLEGTAIHGTGEKEIRLKPGSVYVVPIGSEHGFSCIDHWKVQNIYFLPRTLLSHLMNDSEAYLPLQHFIIRAQQLFQILQFQLDEKTTKEIQRMMQGYQEFSFEQKLFCDCFQRNILLNVLLLVSNQILRQDKRSIMHYDARFLKIAQIILDNMELPTKEILLLIGEKIPFHMQYISRIVKAVTGVSLNTYITELKMEKSLSLLQENYSITEIAQSFGFYDHSHYNKCFRKYFGISPLKYKKQQLLP